MAEAAALANHPRLGVTVVALATLMTLLFNMVTQPLTTVKIFIGWMVQVSLAVGGFVLHVLWNLFSYYAGQNELPLSTTMLSMLVTTAIAGFAF